MNNIPNIFTPTDYYSDIDQARIDRKRIFEDSTKSYLAAKAKDYSTVKDILLSWASINRGVGNNEGRSIMLYRGHLFLKAYLMLGEKLPLFESWVINVFEQCADDLYGRKNNYGSWAILGKALSHKVKFGSLEDGHVFWDRIDSYLDNCSTNDGRMWRECLRTNSGIWYSYFALAPLFEAIYLTRYPDVGQFLKCLSWLFQYANNPQSWPYKPLPWILGIIQGWIWPHCKELEMPHCWGWPGNLFKVAGEYFNIEAWSKYACMAEFQGEDIFIDGKPGIAPRLLG